MVFLVTVVIGDGGDADGIEKPDGGRVVELREKKLTVVRLVIEVEI